MAPATAAAPTVQIRRGTPEDAETLCDIIHRAYRTDASWTTEVDLVAGQRITVEQLRQQLAAGVDPVFVATLPGSGAGARAAAEPSNGDGGSDASAAPAGSSRQVVGCICAEAARNHPDTGLGRGDVLLGLFAVSPDHQSAGVGSRLFAHALQHAQAEMRCSRAVLWVIHTRTELLAWYERLGFAWRGETKPFVFPDLALIDDMHFRVLTKSL